MADAERDELIAQCLAAVEHRFPGGLKNRDCVLLAAVFDTVLDLLALERERLTPTT